MKILIARGVFCLFFSFLGMQVSGKASRMSVAPIKPSLQVKNIPAPFLRAPEKGFSYSDVLVHQAKKAHQDGNLAEAKRLFGQAKALNPHLRDPGWFGIPFVPPPRVSPPTREELLEKADEGISSMTIKILESVLNKNPSDVEVRKVLLEAARRKGNTGEVVRHSSLLSSDQIPEEESIYTVISDYFKGFLFLVLMGGTAWELYQLALEMRGKDRE